MSYQPVSVDDFSVYLNNSNLDVTRAQFVLDRAQALCESVVSPLPTDPGADTYIAVSTVILDVAERAYANPTAVRDTGLGLYSEGQGPFSDTTPGFSGGGLWLTQENKATLRRLNGSGGAFSVDTIPADFVPCLPPWDAGNWSFS